MSGNVYSVVDIKKYQSVCIGVKRHLGIFNVT